MLGNNVQQAEIFTSGFGLLLLVLAFVPSILCIVLFFKVWIMTNDVSKIKDILKEQMDLEHPYVDISNKDKKIVEK
jgi:hypothetical protein